MQCAPRVHIVGTLSDDTHTMHHPVRQDFNKHSEMLDSNTQVVIEQKSQPQRRPRLPQNRIISVKEASPGSVLEQRHPRVAHLGLVVNPNLQVFFHIKCCQTCSSTSYTLKINFLKGNTGLYIHPY